MTKRYSSFKEIDQELEMLKLQREIHLRKVNLQLQQTQELLTPQSIFTSYIKGFSNAISDNYMQILYAAVPMIIKWIWYKKRG